MIGRIKPNPWSILWETYKWIYAYIFDMKYVYAVSESTELSYRVVHRTRSPFWGEHIFIQSGRIYYGYKICRYIEKETYAHTHHGHIYWQWWAVPRKH